MTWLTRIKLACAGVGLAVWGAGYRNDNTVLRWIGIGFLAAAVLLRLVPHLRRRDPAS